MTVIFPSPIFGPIHSRRLGVSLEINLLPEDDKACSFDYIYRECSFNAECRTKKLPPARGKVHTALEERLKNVQANGSAPDALAFAGSGEPTAHPCFPEIMEDTLVPRDKYFPKAKVSILSNSIFIDRPTVFEALNKVDDNILKLGMTGEEHIHLLDRPNGKYSVKKIIEKMRGFKGNCIIQTMFLKGDYQRKDIDNTLDKCMLPWAEAVEEIVPRQVMIYTTNQETPDYDLQKAMHGELDRIVTLLGKGGIPATVSY